MPPTRSPAAFLGVLRDLGMAWRWMWDRRIPMWAKSIPLLAVGYVIWPFDILADPILGLGQLDDLAIIWLGAKAFNTLCTSLLGEERLAGTGCPLEDASDAEIVDTTYRVIQEDEPR